ncbi:hypothetical protein [Burkholderia gladioli]|uniref:hypothetical protein n=1 Tax=Burkholderia gladioli TaxID=28095 RepID=UPI001C26707F|nr:hypothetical protein [Burkholderia gladioli]MBU9379418.1 hypothetical protein [Burkholderia gladioli]
MAEFLARVELHGASDEDYENLHFQLGIFGFVRVVPAVGGGNYRLPTGTYWIESTFNAQAVLGFAQTAAQVVMKDSSIVVAESNEAWFGGLTRVR